MGKGLAFEAIESASQPEERPTNERPLNSVQLLRPSQIDDMKQERESMVRALEQAAHVGNSGRIDRSHMTRQIRWIERELEERTPPKLDPKKLDEAKKRAESLLADIRVGMLSAREMRTNPAGAVGHNVQWSKANKSRIQEYRNIMLTLAHNLGHINPEVATNIERFRPREDLLGPASGDNVQIEPKFYSFPDYKSKIGWTRTFGTPEEKAELEAREKEVSEKEAWIEQKLAQLEELEKRIAEAEKQGGKKGA